MLCSKHHHVVASLLTRPEFQVGTLALELAVLSKHTGSSDFLQRADTITRKLRELAPADGLYPMYINPVRAACLLHSYVSFLTCLVVCRKPDSLWRAPLRLAPVGIRCMSTC